MRFYIETFGCTSNFGNSRELAEALQEMGHTPSGLKEAEAVIVNTCAVTERTERKVLRRLRELEGERLVVAGCLAKALPESIHGIICRKVMGLLNGGQATALADLFGDSSSSRQAGQESMPNASLSCSPSSSPLCLPRSSAPASTHSASSHPTSSLPTSSQPTSSQPTSSLSTSPLLASNHCSLCSIVNVAEGCNGSCSYCIVRKARGGLKSRPPEEIIEQIKRVATAGAAEIQIAAQDTAAYGQDLGFSLAGLLQMASRVTGDFQLRVGMMNPDSILFQLEELIEAFSSPKVYKFLHIPLQSGSDEILQSMGRKYNSTDFLAVADAFRKEYEDITIITDIITGFPGEREDHFLESMRAIDRLQPDKVNVTRFSQRPGTGAAGMYDMPDRIKKDRSRAMTELWLDIAARRNLRYLGRLLPCLVVEAGKEGTVKARAANYLGVVVVGEKIPLGSRLMVEITECNSFYVSGRAVD